jgi:hypothetical protein
MLERRMERREKRKRLLFLGVIPGMVSKKLSGNGAEIL